MRNQPKPIPGYSGRYQINRDAVVIDSLNPNDITVIPSYRYRGALFVTLVNRSGKKQRRSLLSLLRSVGLLPKEKRKRSTTTPTR